MAAGINGFTISYEPSAADRVTNFGTTQLKGFNISFELSQADKKYYETTSINGFSISFEYSPLRGDSIIKRRLQ